MGWVWGFIAILCFLIGFSSNSAFAQDNGITDMDIATYIGVIIAVIATVIGVYYAAKAENRASDERTQGVVEGYSNQITELRDKESSLKSASNCEAYAVNYVDLMDRIAYLYRSETLPTETAGYFENEFAYALTMIQWIEKHNVIDKLPKGKDSMWTDLLGWCNEKIDPLDEAQLPMPMQKYDELPVEEVDRVRMLQLIEGYSQQITELKNKERSLKTTTDCETYAINYVDLMDQIAFLYAQESIPKDIGRYFENEFAYALTMIQWIEKHNVIDKLPKGKDSMWTDLLGWCNEKIDPLDEAQLPMPMQKYDELPVEEVDRVRLLDLIKDYGKILADFTKQERDLKTKIDCEVYAMAYLDTLDQIAYLQKQKAIPQEVTNYFENNFAYGLNLWEWYNQNVRDKPIEKDEIEPTWTDLKGWSKEKNIEPFDGEVLPKPMLLYKELE